MTACVTTSSMRIGPAARYHTRVRRSVLPCKRSCMAAPGYYKKLKRRWHNLKLAGNVREAAKVRARMDKCVLTTKHSHKKRRRDSKSKAAAKASRAHDQLICTIIPLIAHWAAAPNSLIVLENLRGMFEGWSKQKGMFGKGLRRGCPRLRVVSRSNLCKNYLKG